MKKILLILLLFFTIIVFSFPEKFEKYSRPLPKNDTVFTPEDIASSVDDANYISYTNFRLELNILYNTNKNITKQDVINKANNRKIRIDTPEELYRFSIDVSFHEESASDNPYTTNFFTIEVKKGLMALNYVLGNDIDYISMRSKQFIPIGFIYREENTLIEKEVLFTGTFDGRGFEIKNLMLANIDYITYDDDVTLTTYALTTYFSMFAYNDGIIRSIGLISPNIELLDYDLSIKSFSNLVGLNRGTVSNVYVVDNRTSPFNAGIRVRVPSGTTGTVYTAAGIVHSNTGTFNNSYFSSPAVINGNYFNGFYVEPVVYNNNKTKDVLIYDSTRYISQSNTGGYSLDVNTPKISLATGETTSVLNSSSSSLNNANGHWYYYGTYPTILGLDFDEEENAYLIHDELDFIAFSKLLLNPNRFNETYFISANYLITNDIDMSRVSKNAFKTINVEFEGELNGLDQNNNRKYIKNLNIENGINSGGIYSSGIFRSLKGDIKNIVFSNASISINNSSQYYSSTYLIGLIAGTTKIQSNITNVSANVSINLGTQVIGTSHVGGIAGKASGQLSQIYLTGLINGNTHSYTNNELITADYSIGGVVGSNGVEQLILYQIKNEINIKGISTTANSVVSPTQVPIIKIGGIIGRINNETTRNIVRQVYNKGNIEISTFSSSTTIQYVGGIFGLSSGLNYDLSNMYSQTNVGVNGWKNEYWKNDGNILNTINTNNIVKAAGIGVSNHSENVEFAYLENNGGFTSPSFNSFKYTGLIYDISNSNVTLSQSINTTKFIFNYYVKNFSPIYYSENNNTTLLRYVENSGDVIFRGFENKTDTLYVSGITQSNNVDFLNVYYSGNIVVYDIDSTKDIYASGITTTLNQNRYIKQSLNQGNIYVSAINNSSNTYVGGLTSINLSGDLHTGANVTSTQPTAIFGIIDSINSANISTTTPVEYISTLTKVTFSYGIKGDGNVYVGGITSQNNGSIQDTMNMGNLTIYQGTEISKTSISIDSTNTAAGLITNILGGVVVGGIASIVTGPNSRIYDTVNNGEVIGIAYSYARSGGILGVTLYDEIAAGKVVPMPSSADKAARRNETSSTILSNSINFGTVIAVTKSISEYTAGNGTEDRPAIYACAGGVIGYGLSVMKRMINHGDVYSTDVAGGVIGATYAIGNVTTTVNINTAIHYGSVQAIKTANYGSISKEIMSKSNVRGINDANMYKFTDSEDLKFYFPQTTGDLTQVPLSKRGFGGVFGRLQRGYSGIMTSSGGSFDYIVNADKNVDLIGRLDQVQTFTQSSSYFRFASEYYFSAKVNDTTQAVFSGYKTNYIYYEKYEGTAISASVNVVSKTRQSGSGQNAVYSYTLDYTYTTINTTRTNYYTYSKTVGNTTVNNIEEITGQTQLAGNTLLPVAVRKTETGNNSLYGNAGTTTNKTINNEQVTATLTVSNDANTRITVEKPLITETPGGAGKYIYDPNFVMRDPNTKLATGESISSYIYYVNADVLSTTQKEKRQNGMYVLTTTSGSKFGSILPANISITNIYRLKDNVSPNVNYGALNESLKEEFDTSFKTRYNLALQTIYNEKSELLEENQEIYLEENNTNTPIANGVVDNINKKVTFEASLNLFAPTSTTATFSVGFASISEKALLASTNYSSYIHEGNVLTIEQFQDLLYAEKDSIVSKTLAPIFSVDISNVQTDVDIYIGKLRVYSEAAVNDPIFMNVNNISLYTTEYNVYIRFKARNTSETPISITGVSIDGASVSQTSFFNNYNDFPVNNNIKFTFSDSNKLLQTGTDISPFVSLYYLNEKVDYNYYTITSNAVNSSGVFDFTIYFTDSLVGGSYEIRYKYFSYETDRVINVRNAYSTQNTIYELKYYSFYNPLSITDGKIATLIDFNAPLINGPVSFIENTLSNFAYLSNRRYVVFGVEEFEIIVSPFASLVSISYEGFKYNDNGYREYYFKYVIKSEAQVNTDGSNGVTYEHTITEKSLNVLEVKKDDNAVSTSNLFATREALQTKFSINFGINSSLSDYIYNLDTQSSYGFIRIISTNITNGSIPIDGVLYGADELLYIYITSENNPGIYKFEFEFVRYNSLGIEEVVIIGAISIEKKAGEDAYLKNIQFTDVVTTSYFDVFQADKFGNKVTNSPYIMKVFYDGIDYDNSDKNGVQYYRIDGKVPNIPLNDYYPNMVEYLPAGASVSRGKFVNNVWVGGPEVYADATDEEKSVLGTDYTYDQETGEEGNIVIAYRVRSEDGNNFTYYFISVIDVMYNVTLSFSIYYLENGVETIAYNSLELKNKTIFMKVENFNAYLGKEKVIATEALAENVSDFPTFNSIGGYNNSFIQFNTPNSDEYLYLFGRNMSGFYKISLDLPKTSAGLNIYKYDIIYNNQYLPKMNQYISGEKGNYYYIETAERNRTRNFKIVVSKLDEPTGNPYWGLTDYYDTWK